MKKTYHRIVSFLLAVIVAGAACSPGVFALSGSEGQPTESAGSVPASLSDGAQTSDESGSVPAATPIPTAAPAPEDTPIPTATPAPAATSVPAATPIPEATPVPEAAPAPEAAPMQDSLEGMEHDLNAGSDPDPAPLNLEMLVEEQGFSALRSAMLRTSGLPGSTIVVGDDNEDGAHSGKPDGDIDIIMSNRYGNCYPIEVRLDVGEQLPRESAVLAIKAYDVDEESDEKDDVFFNGVKIGRLSGTNNTWNTTILTVPTSLVKSGANYLEITINTGWVVRIDWVQLLLDGGEKSGEVESFDLTLGQASQSSSYTVLLPVTVEIQSSGSGTYDTEFALLDEAGNSVAAAFGTASASGQSTVQMAVPTGGMTTGTYRVVGLLKDPDTDTETILAQDTVDWYYYAPDPTLLTPTLKASASPAGQVARQVDVTITAEPAEGMVIQKLTAVEIAGQPASTTGSLSFTVEQNMISTQVEVEYTLNGEQKTATIPAWVNVDNIDLEPPTVTLGNDRMKVDAEATDEWVRQQVLEQATVADGVSENGNDMYAGVADVRCELSTQNIAAQGGTATVIATDYAGNVTKKEVSIEPVAPPLQMGQPTATRNGQTASFALAAALLSTGGIAADETGFVWGTMQNPTLSLNNGKSVSSPAVGEGGNITATAEIADGVNYYARAYVTIKNVTYYSQQVTFSVGAKNYGTVSIQNNGNNTFTVSRNGTDGAQTVYYRTVNGSAVGGTHFTHQADTVTLQEGQTSATITIAEAANGANTAYGGYPATAYSNADRTYQVEIYRVEGGATIGGDSRATRTLNTSQRVGRALFDEYTVNIDKKQRGDYEDDNKLGWTEGETGSAARETAEVKQEGIEYWRHTAQSLHYYLTFQAQEVNDGYQAIQLLSGNALDTRVYPYKGNIKFQDNISLDASSVYYIALFEHGKSGKEDAWYSYSFPTAGTGFPGDSKLTVSRYRSGQAGSFLTFPLDTASITAGFGASGSGNDKWNTRNAQHHIQVYDAKEPELLAVAPMAAATYKPGDTVTVSLVFDEIVDGTNSYLTEEVAINTNWGPFTYAGGADTNVLFFTRTVPENAGGKDLTVTSILNPDRIKDMCGPAGAAPSFNVSGDTGVDGDFTVPSIAISAQPVSGSTASATVTVTKADSMQYVWTQSEDMPVNGWQDFASGATLSTRQQPGESWYLHILAEYTSTGAAAHKFAKFVFPSGQTAALPTLTATVDNTGWARQRDIQLTYTPTGAAVAVTGPDGTTWPLNGGKTVTATENGWYSFTLTSDGETLTQAVKVENIDGQAPVAEELREPSVAATVSPSLSFSAVISDALSGLKTVEYCFSEAQTAPQTGWTIATPSNGRYFFAYTADSEEKKTVYLHLRATDNAGNVWQHTSGGYQVQKPPTEALTVSLAASTGIWTAGEVNLTWKLGGMIAGETITLYGAGNGPAVPVSTQMGAFPVTQNGLYTVVAMDSRGRTGEASIPVNNIDKAAPFVSKVEVAPGWTNQPKTVTLVGLSDDSTPQYDAQGNVTGYSGIGVASTQYKMAAADALTDITGDSFTVAENGKYALILTDELGNKSTRLFTVAGIDTAAPAARLSSVPAGWQNAPVNVTLTFSDADSGVASVQTAFVESDAASPAEGALQSQDIGAGQVTLTAQQGQHYLYYKVTDNAGNVTDGFSGLIQVDAAVPTLTVTQTAQQGAATLEVRVNDSLSGVKAWYSRDDGAYQELTSDTLTLNAPGTYRFKAVSGAGLESAVYTAALHQVRFDTPEGVDAPTLQLILEGGSVAKPGDPARTGYDFAGWQRDGAAWDFDAPVAASFTLTAAWTLHAPTVGVTAAYHGQSGGDFTYDGGDLVFTAAPGHEASGVSYTYQWQDAGGQPIAGATGPSYTVKAAAAGTHQYSCAVTAIDGSLVSAPVTMAASATIQKQIVPAPAQDDTAFVYNGKAQTYTVAADSRYTVSGDEQTNAGGHTVTVALVDKANYRWNSGGSEDLTYPFTIAKAPVRFSATDTSHNYDGSEKAAVVTPQTDVADLAVAAGDYTVHCEQNGQAARPMNVGDYDIIVTLRNDNLAFDGQAADLRRMRVGVLTINGVRFPAADTMTWPAAAPLAYGQTLAESVLTGGDQQDAGSYAWKTPDAIPTVGNGGCTVVFTPNDKNYSPVEHTVAVEVAPKGLAVAGVTAETRPYDPAGTAVTLSGGSLEGEIVRRNGEPDDVTLVVTGAAGSVKTPDAGQDKPVTVSGYALAGADAANYTLTQPGYVTVTITPAEGAASLTMESWAYGETPARPKAASATNGTDAVTWRYAGTLADGSPYDSDVPPTDAGSYTVQAVFAATNNYRQVTKQAGFTVEKRGITVTWNRLDAVYNGAAQAPEIAGLVGVLAADAGRVEASAAHGAQTAAGTYSASARLTGERAHNYVLQNGAATFAIRPAPVTFRVEGSSVLYDGQSHTAAITAQALGQPFDGFAIRYQTMDGAEVTAPQEAGRYRILAEITDPNYRHGDGADGSAQQIGVLEIYQAAAPAAYSVTFLPGAEDAAGAAPTLPASLAGGILILPGPGGLERAGYRFAGWQYEGRVYSAESSFVMPAENVTFTAAWDETSYAIDGSVIWEGTEGENAPQPVEKVLVTLTRGNEQIAQTQTGPDGSFSFQQVSAGLYNLVATYGGIVQTQKVELVDRDQNQCVIRLPRGNTNSVLKVLDGAPPVVVGNLDNVFTPQPDEVYTAGDRKLVESGGTVEVRMTVADASPVPDSPLADALESVSQGFREGLTLDLTMGKTRLDADGSSLSREPIAQSNLLIEIVIPLNGALQNCRSYRVLREHEGAVDEIGAQANAQGEYFVLNESRTALTIFAKQFSLYSVLYSNALPEEGGESPQTRPAEPTPAPQPAAPATAKPADQAEKPADQGEEHAPAPAATPQPPRSTPPPQQESGEAAQDPAGAQPGGRPFALLNAAASLLGVLLAVFASSRGKARLLSAACAAGALVLTLLTAGWNGFVLADAWTLPVAALALLAAYFSRRAQTPVSEDDR